MNYKFQRFVESELNLGGYVFLDPPWNYTPHKNGGEFWNDVTYLDIFLHLNASIVFLYVTLDRLPQVVAAYNESRYELKGLIPYCRVLKNEDAMYSIQNTFRAPLMYVAVLQAKEAVQLHEVHRKVIVERDNEFSRPIRWEDAMFQELDSLGLRGLYILPTGEVADCGSVLGPKMNKKELF